MTNKWGCFALISRKDLFIKTQIIYHYARIFFPLLPFNHLLFYTRYMSEQAHTHTETETETEAHIHICSQAHVHTLHQTYILLPAWDRYKNIGVDRGRCCCLGKVSLWGRSPRFCPGMEGLESEVSGWLITHLLVFCVQLQHVVPSSSEVRGWVGL